MRIVRETKTGALLFSSIVVLFLMVSFGLSQAYWVDAWFDNRTGQYMAKEDGYYFILDLRRDYVGELDNVSFVTAVNTDAGLYNDYETYYFEIVFTGNNVLEIVSYNIYTGQGGQYEVTIHFEDDSTGTYTTPYIAPRSNPIPIPENLHVDFSNGFDHPTLTFSSVDDATVDLYRYALYIEPYRERLLARYESSDPDNDAFTYYPGPNQGGTGESLQIGKVYLLRAEAYDFDTGAASSFYRSFGYLAFLVPDPNVHYTYEYLRTIIEDEGSGIPAGIKQSLLAKIEAYDQARLNAFINEVSALKGKKIYRWLADILIQCAKGILETP